MIECSFVTGYQHAINYNTYNKIMTEEWLFTVNSAAKLYVSFYTRMAPPPFSLSLSIQIMINP